MVRQIVFAVVELPQPPQTFFASDNFSSAHPRYLDAIASANAGHARAYGDDRITRDAVTAFQELCDLDVEVMFTFNGTGSNVVALGSLLQPADSVLCTNWSHINVDETGAPEHILGIKLQDVDSANAKLNSQHIHDVASAIGNVHHVQPGVVSITQATELGTLYSVDEIRELCDVAHSYGMRVHLDGARIANAVAALGGTRETFRNLTFGAGVDAVSFGGTKNGMLGAEAVLLRRESVSPRARHIQKRTTQLPSKQRYIASQFLETFRDDLWITTAAHANAMATRLFEKVKHLSSLCISAPQVNSMYPIISPDVKAELQQWSFFWDWDIASSQVRWMTSWDTTVEDVDAFAAGVCALVDK